MKKLLFMASWLCSIAMAGQAVDTPEAVLSAFEEKYPEAEEVTWNLSGSNYQASFIEIQTMKAIFSSDGKWLKTTAIVSEDDLPYSAIEYIYENYEEASISQVQFIEDYNSQTTYLVIFYAVDEKLKLRFDSEGMVIE